MEMGGGVWKYNNTNIRTFTDLDGFNPDDWQESTGVFDSNENLWLGSATGLYKIRNEKILDFFTIKDGLPSNKINNLGLDNFGNVWGVTDQGLFSIIDSEITNYATKYDFKNLNYHRLSIGKNGIVWMQGNGILSSFDGENVKNYFSNDSITIVVEILDIST